MSGYYELLTLFALLLTDMNGNLVRFKELFENLYETHPMRRNRGE